MRILITIAIILLSFCNFIGDKSKKNVDPEKKEPESLLLKITWINGDVKVIRDKSNILVTVDQELEKDDIIQTGENGIAELLLGLDHSIRMNPNTEISISNLLTIEGNTATNISVNQGSIVTVILADSSTSLMTLVTPNIQANIIDSVLLTEVIHKNPKLTKFPCDKVKCNTNVIALDGNVRIKKLGNSSEVILEKNSQVTISNEEELTQSKIEPFNKSIRTEIGKYLRFHSKENQISQEILNEYIYIPETVKKISKSPENKKLKTIKSQNKGNKKSLPKSKSIPKNQLRKDFNRDTLKLDSNQGF